MLPKLWFTCPMPCIVGCPMVACWLIALRILRNSSMILLLFPSPDPDMPPSIASPPPAAFAICRLAACRWLMFSIMPPANESTRRPPRSEEHTSELQSPYDLVCRLLLEKKKKQGNKVVSITNTKKKYYIIHILKND